MSRNLPLPFFPIPPNQYTPQYFAEIVRAFSLYMEQIQNPGEGRHTDLVLTGIPTDDSGLEDGGLFSHDGFVRIPLANRPHVRGSIGTGNVGSVTVVTT